MTKRINWEHAEKISAVLQLLTMKRAPGTKYLRIAYGDGWLDSRHIATYAEELQGMDEALLDAVRWGAVDAIDRYITEKR